jgi:hypothetical protein
MKYGHIASKVIKKVGRKAIAEHFRIAKESTYTWEKSGIPPSRVLDLEALSGISRHVIRPDIFGSLTKSSRPDAELECRSE